MITKAISLFSGGLDSIIAVKVIQDQGISVQGVTFETPFFNSRKARETARHIQLPLLVIDITDSHLAMLKAPRYGYGKNMNPCIDCHTLMLRTAGKIMEETGADFLFTGEVLGQRPMSQTRQSLHIVAKNSGYPDYIVRPLSAQLLDETRPELGGMINRRQLLAIQGRGRKVQMEMAKFYGVHYYPPPAGGCLLTDPMFSRRLKDLFSCDPGHSPRDIELLKYGRHFRSGESGKIIVGRNHKDNEALQKLIRCDDTFMCMDQLPGPLVLIPGGGKEEIIINAARLCVLYSDAPENENAIVNITSAGQSHLTAFLSASRNDAAEWII
ncbi:MAG: tRNA 4-thiouridine(8) synthase ThiI [Syntrophales bacterium]|nr:tRNA 4-thiouridine(8) synthase ThiI [Syntrophales bacterium]MCK9390768.1 tRNA 4-thiouridine(8) synthase ThiI [Syntrophales bacterium]